MDTLLSSVCLPFKIIRILSGKCRFRSVAFNHTGSLLSAGSDDEIIITDLTSEAKYSIADHDDFITALQFTAISFTDDGFYLASGSKDCAVSLWKIFPPEKHLQTPQISAHNFLSCFKKTDNKREVSCLKFCFEDRYLAVGSLDGTISFMDTTFISEASDQRKPIQHIFTGREVYSIAISSDDRHIVAGYESGRVEMFATVDGSLALSSKRHLLQVTSICYSATGQLLATGSWDKTVKLSTSDDLASQAKVLSLPSAVFSLAFNPVAPNLACGIGSPDRCVVIWDWERESQRRLPLFMPAANGVAYRADGAALAYAAEGNRVLLWDVLRGDARLAVAMALHRRLGSASPLALLEPGTLHFIAGLLIAI